MSLYIFGYLLEPCIFLFSVFFNYFLYSWQSFFENHQIGKQKIAPKIMASFLSLNLDSKRIKEPDQRTRPQPSVLFWCINSGTANSLNFFKTPEISPKKKH
jgi:hypothetical protein